LARFYTEPHKLSCGGALMLINIYAAFANQVGRQTKNIPSDLFEMGSFDLDAAGHLSEFKGQAAEGNSTGSRCNYIPRKIYSLLREAFTSIVRNALRRRETRVVPTTLRGAVGALIAPLPSAAPCRASRGDTGQIASVTHLLAGCSTTLRQVIETQSLDRHPPPMSLGLVAPMANAGL
jgi:hypothetical protein